MSVASDGDDVPCSVNVAGATPSVAVQLRESLAETARLLRVYDQQQETTGEVPSLEMYQKCCRQLITYLAENMETSSGFTQQMDKVIDASYINTSGNAVRTLVTRDLWLRCDADSRQEAELQTPAHQRTRIKTDMDTSVVVTPLAIANASVTEVRPTCSPHVDLTASTPSTVGRVAKRPKKTTTMPSKRPRHTVSRNLYGSGSLTEESETETESDEGQRSENRAPVVYQQDNSKDFEWPCSRDGAVARSDGFKKHLETALRLVDAENCDPPSGLVCTHNCHRMRDSMCETHREQGCKAMPCHDGMCLVWRVVDKHLVRCQDSQCEFKNRVGLRQTLHDIQQAKLKLEETTPKLQAAKAGLAQVDSESSTSHAQLESRIERLEGKCSKLGDAVGFHNEREHTFWADLRTIGVHRGNDGMDGLPSFENHYARQ